MSTEDQKRTEGQTLEAIYGPKVSLRLMTDEIDPTGFTLSIDWYDQPSVGEIIVAAESLLKQYGRLTSPQLMLTVDPAHNDPLLEAAARRIREGKHPKAAS